MNKELNPIDVALLYFKVLLATTAYKNYCHAKVSDDKLTAKTLLIQHPNLDKIWLFWGDIYCFDKNLNEVKYFHQWFDQNHDKFHRVSFNRVQLVREGTVITARKGVIYCTIPKNVNANMIKQLFKKTGKQIKSAANKMGGEYVLSLNRDKKYTPAKTLQYQRAIGVLYWRNYLGLTPKQTIFIAYRRDDRAWDNLRTKVDKYHKLSSRTNLKDLNLIDLQTVVRDIDRLRMQGEIISNSVLNEDFTFPALANPI